ncbi:MAG: bifunctional diaminohydroxyphosphoribosylaminopyrimidine deaminase/5-amino-6-(5-phosphoribosylamino)uracil reductase RibD [Actinobacteria bacterium]|nr:bifunctional diaminohydroxyphosphoribosylaminopyrimidine deaminase/5-amino-6-(5-phosphoribosylamino)uracil reductase RibD [Actinomycetota bacterium]
MSEPDRGIEPSSIESLVRAKLAREAGQRPEDRLWMSLAIHEAWRSRRSVAPRPWVGAVVVPGAVATRASELPLPAAISRFGSALPLGHRSSPGCPEGAFAGSTQGAAGPHAEIVALLAAGALAAGATLYVTLEPCAHFGQTPPCADAVIEAGIRRVVIGLQDPDPKVAGAGIAKLEAAGVEVTTGVMAPVIEAQLAPYLAHRRTGRPYVVLKLAATVDGRTAAPDGTSRWITGDEARLDAHRLRADSDAILAGAGTVRADDPALTVRLPLDEADTYGPVVEPIRVVLGTAGASAKVHPCLEVSGDLGAALDDLGERGIVQLMIEGGASVAHDFHAAGLVDRYVIYLAPALFGGDDATPLFTGPGAGSITDVWRGRFDGFPRPLGADVRIDLVPRADEREEGT